jgi:hypothetical protein
VLKAKYPHGNILKAGPKQGPLILGKVLLQVYKLSNGDIYGELAMGLK